MVALVKPGVSVSVFEVYESSNESCLCKFHQFDSPHQCPMLVWEGNSNNVCKCCPHCQTICQQQTDDRIDAYLDIPPDTKRDGVKCSGLVGMNEKTETTKVAQLATTSPVGKK